MNIGSWIWSVAHPVTNTRKRAVAKPKAKAVKRAPSKMARDTVTVNKALLASASNLTGYSGGGIISNNGGGLVTTGGGNLLSNHVARFKGGKF